MKPSTRRSLLALAILSLALSYVAAAKQVDLLSSGDKAAVRAVLERYRSAWLANDEGAVLGTFSGDAILMPAHGNPPIVGTNSIKAFWWPQSATTTTITKVVQTLDEVGGDGTLAYARGLSDVEWRTEDKGTSQSWQNSSSFMFLLKRQSDGTWRISHLIWDAGENRLVK